MIATLALTCWIVALIYIIRAGGPIAIFRALGDKEVPKRYKIVLALCALPIPGPLDEIVAAGVLSRIAERNRRPTMTNGREA